MGAPLAGPGPYTVDANNPAQLVYYRLSSAEWTEWQKQKSPAVSLRELFLRNGGIDWWWFAGEQHNACSKGFFLDLNGGAISPHPPEVAQGAANVYFGEKFDGDIIVRPGDFFEVYGIDNANAVTRCGTITVPMNEYWLLISWKIWGAQVE